MANTADGETRSSRWRRRITLWAPVVGLTLLAGALRLISLGDIPPGLYRDEAFNGLDALRILDGSFPVYFTANHGREPLFLYLVAGTVGILGRTPGAVRLAAAICGTLTVPVTYFMTQAWFGRKAALLSAAILSTTVWHVHLSRIGFRAVTLPLLIGCFLWSSAHALRSNGRAAWLAAGILYGIGFYTYVAARLTPVALIGVVAYMLLTDRGDRLWPGALYFSLGALAALIPLGAYAIRHWDVVMGRPGQVSVLNPAVHRGDLWGTLRRNLIGTLGMFFVRGDTIPRHNIPGRPVFTPLMGAALVLGTTRAIVQARSRDVGAAVVLIWVATMMIPTIAAADAPHFLRAVGILPLLVVLPALGLETVWNWATRRDRRVRGSVLLAVVLTLALGSAVRDYFYRYGASSEARYAFESAATELAAGINRFKGLGWDGQGIAVSKPTSGRQHNVYMDKRLWQAWKGLSFLVPEQEGLTRFDPDAMPPLTSAGPSLLLLWPYGNLESHLAALPHPVRIEPQVGPPTRGDLEDRAYPAYASYLFEPLGGQPAAPLARFGESIELVDFTSHTEGRTQEVRLTWRAAYRPSDDYTVFVSLCETTCTESDRVVQDDQQPGTQFYPTSLWFPGDTVVDIREIELPPGKSAPSKAAVGLYSWPALERLPVTGPSGTEQRDMFVLPTGD